MKRLRAEASVTPTLRGWFVLLSGAVIPGIGRFLGIEELYEIGVALVVAVISSMVAVHRRKRQVRLVRRVRPEKGAIAGRPLTVEIEITNLDDRPTTVLELEDRLDGIFGKTQKLGTQGLRRRASTRVSYTVTPPSRGRFAVGPAQLRTIDPFGFARGTHGEADTTEMYVYPEVEALTSPMPEGGTVVVGAESPATAPSRGGEEFYAIRGFRSGDDLRKIHWKSTARFGEPMIRQEERRSEPMTTVALDSGIGEEFERRVSAAGSVINDVSLRRHSYRLIVTPTPAGLPLFGQGFSHYHSAMEELAKCSSRDGSVLDLLGELKVGTSGNTVLITSVLEASWLPSWPHAEDDGWGVIVLIGDLPKPELVRTFEHSHIAIVHSLDGKIAPAWDQRFGSVRQGALAR